MDSFTFAQVEDFDGIVAQRADEQPVTRRIQREVVDASFHTGQRDCLCQFKRRDALCSSHGDANAAPGDGTISCLPSEGRTQRCIGELTLSSPPAKSPPFTACAKSLAEPRPQ